MCVNDAMCPTPHLALWGSLIWPWRSCLTFTPLNMVLLFSKGGREDVSRTNTSSGHCPQEGLPLRNCLQQQLKSMWSSYRYLKYLTKCPFLSNPFLFKPMVVYKTICVAMVDWSRHEAHTCLHRLRQTKVLMLNAHPNGNICWPYFGIPPKKWPFSDGLEGFNALKLIGSFLHQDIHNQ